MTGTLDTSGLNKILQQNCFAVFNLPLQYTIDQKDLDNKYQTLQKQLHPDNFINHPDSTLSVMVSAHINNSYNTLTSPLLKAIALLHQNNIAFDLNTDKTLPANFLAEQMKLYEEIEDASQDANKLNVLLHKLVTKIHKLETQIAQNFECKNFTSVIETTKKLAFYNKLDRLINQKIEESW